MNISGNTILITGGGSGIGKGLAEAFHKEGNKVIIAGRRREALDGVIAANPGMKSATLDIADAANIAAFGEKMAKEFPSLNAVIHNAGIMKPENIQTGGTTDAEAMININLVGPIRLTAALLPLLKKQKRSTIMTVSSGLAFLPLAMTPTYCATKAALHSYTMSLRWQLRGTNVDVVELIPPYVATELMGPQQIDDPRAMPLADFITEVMDILKKQPAATEICVNRVKPLRLAAESEKFDEIFKGLNESMPAAH